MLVVPASSSVVALDVSAPGWEDERGEHWWRSGPGEWLLLPLFPGGLTCENPETGCVCVVWAYPGWRADDSVFSPSW